MPSMLSLEADRLQQQQMTTPLPLTSASLWTHQNWIIEDWNNIAWAMSDESSWIVRSEFDVNNTKAWIHLYKKKKCIGEVWTSCEMEQCHCLYGLSRQLSAILGSCYHNKVCVTVFFHPCQSSLSLRSETASQESWYINIHMYFNICFNMQRGNVWFSKDFKWSL